MRLMGRWASLGGTILGSAARGSTKIYIILNISIIPLHGHRIIQSNMLDGQLYVVALMHRRRPKHKFENNKPLNTPSTSTSLWGLRVVAVFANQVLLLRPGPGLGAWARGPSAGSGALGPDFRRTFANVRRRGGRASVGLMQMYGRTFVGCLLLFRLRAK